MTRVSKNQLCRLWPRRLRMLDIFQHQPHVPRTATKAVKSIMKKSMCLRSLGLNLFEECEWQRMFESGSLVVGEKGFNYDPPSLLKTCDLLCVAIGGLM